ncbi:uncharacterized protein METZ01_LOCUS374438, partial [marine metagenome]
MTMLKVTILLIRLASIAVPAEGLPPRHLG